jgi:general stress protein 26
MPDVTFEEIEPEFHERVRKVVWCTVATVDTKGNPRSRVLHPMWEGRTGWIMTPRNSLKARHLATNPRVSLTYWESMAAVVVQVEAIAAWADEPSERQRIWDLFKNTPPPPGYDPGEFWKDGPHGGTFGVLKLTPLRIELSGVAAVAAGKPYSRVWRA